ncbi:MAG: hypothetical protein ABSH56_19885 [Bryobacteraceae bacterium]
MSIPEAETAADIVVISLKEKSLKIKRDRPIVCPLDVISRGMHPGRRYLNTLIERYQKRRGDPPRLTDWLVVVGDTAMSTNGPRVRKSRIGAPDFNWRDYGATSFQFLILGSQSGATSALENLGDWVNTPGAAANHVGLARSVQALAREMLLRRVVPAAPDQTELVADSKDRFELIFRFYAFPPKFALVT